ncbi:hypothetical protein LTR04_000607 [Oleoguttula sp. CCFEE 6159]|nr:hypothetical protein LTR04_000607 [Oleoguttula sp. CCFEE 6159]
MDGLYRHHLRAVLKHSMSLVSASSFDDVDDTVLISSDGEQQKDPRAGRLTGHIVWSRRFILSYNVVLIGILIGFTVLHWVGKVTRARRRRRVRRATSAQQGRQPCNARALKDGNEAREADTGSTTSSSNSTLEGASTPPRVANKDYFEYEQTPLLSTTREPKSGKGALSFTYHVRSWLMYQPPPITYLHKTLPSIGATLALSAFIDLNIFYTFYRVPLTIPMLFVFADRTALLFVANLPILYLLAAKNQPIKLLTGYSYEALNIVHRRLGELLCLLALLHSVGMTGVWYTILRPVGFTLARFLLTKIIVLGLGAFVAYELLYFTSLGSFRQRWYELFLVLHVVLQTAALVLVWFHHSGSRPYVGVALGIFLLDRLVLRLGMKTKTMRASLSIAEDGETVLVSANWQLLGKRTLWQKLFGLDIGYGWKATEHVFLTVPSLSRKHAVQAHPFTIASAAPPSSDSHAWLSLVIRAHDGFSRDLLTHAQRHGSTTIRLDGPYGSQHAMDMLQDCGLVVVIAGGSGIAVGFPIVWSLLNQPPDPEGQADVDRTRKKICLIWVVHQREHTRWIGDERLDELRQKGLHIIIPDPTSEAGRPDVGALVEELIGESSDGRRAGVVCSGPDGMNRAVRNICADMVKRGRNRC